MVDYFAHKLSLKCKLLAKRKCNAPLPPSVVVAGDQSPAKLCVSLAVVTSAFDSLAENQSSRDIVSQVKSMFATFAESLEARFSSVDQRFSQVISSSASDNQDRLMSAVRMPFLTVLLQLQLQWQCVLSIRLIGLSPCCTPTIWEPPEMGRPL